MNTHTKAQFAIIACASIALVLGMASTARSEGCKEKKSVKVALADVPAAAKAAIEKEAGSATVSEIKKKEKDGKTLYKAEFTKDGKIRPLL